MTGAQIWRVSCSGSGAGPGQSKDHLYVSEYLSSTYYGQEQDGGDPPRESRPTMRVIAVRAKPSALSRTWGGLRHRVGDQESFSGVVWCEGKGFEVAGRGAG